MGTEKNYKRGNFYYTFFYFLYMNSKFHYKYAGLFFVQTDHHIKQIGLEGRKVAFELRDIPIQAVQRNMMVLYNYDQLFGSRDA